MAKNNFPICRPFFEEVGIGSLFGESGSPDAAAFWAVVGEGSAAVEAVKLGHGGIEYLTRLLGCDPQTIRQGLAELEADAALVIGRQRKKGADANR